MKLRRSFDRKVTNLAKACGKQARIANCFGLPSGKSYSCIGETEVCKQVCYAGRLEKLYPSVKKLLLQNWNLLREASYSTTVSLLAAMVDEFKVDCDKWQARPIFRIHWDGDFFHERYWLAWADVVCRNPDIKFWVYTRVEAAAVDLRNIANLSLYYSTDSENVEIGTRLNADYGIKLASLGYTFEAAKQLTDVRSVKCPENRGSMPLISASGSACDRCSLCVTSDKNVLFSISKK
jgi:hypothetical protein